MARMAVFLSGVLGVCAQVFILRALVASLGVNEFFVAVFLGLWVVFEGAGAFWGDWLWKKFIKGRFPPGDFFAWLVLSCALSVVGSLLLTPWARILSGVSFGVAVGLWDAVLAFAAFGGVAAFFHGASFPAGCLVFEQGDGLSSGLGVAAGPRRMSGSAGGTAYAWETFGSFVGGVVVWAVFLWGAVSPSRPLAAAATCAFAAVLSSGLLARRPTRRFSLVAAAAAAATALAAPTLTKNLIALHGCPADFTITDTRITPYQTLTLFQSSQRAPSKQEKSSPQYTIFSDGKPLFTFPEPNILFAEELIHYTSLMISAPPEHIALVGLPASGLITTALNIPDLKEITIIEPDATFINMAKNISPPLSRNDPRLKFVVADPLRFFAATPQKYNVIIINSPLPATLLANRLYTKEFFRLASSALDPHKESILAFHIEGSETYISPDAARLNLAIIRAAQKIFPSNVYSLPATGGLSQTNIYFCKKNNATAASANSDDEILPKPPDMETLLLRAKRGEKITSSVVARDYLTARFSNVNRLSYEDALKRELTIVPDGNEALRPIACYYAMQFENSRRAPNAHSALKIFSEVITRRGTIILSSSLLIISLLIYLLLYRTKKKPAFARATIYASMVSVGFSGMSLCLMIMFIFQTTYGYIYALFGLLVASFMAGAALGAALSNKRISFIKNHSRSRSKRYLIWAHLLMSVCSILLAVLTILCAHDDLAKISPLIYLILSGIVGFISGLPYPLASDLLCGAMVSPTENRAKSDTADFFRGRLYGAELAGGAAAGFLGGMILLPLSGAPASFFLVASIEIFTASLILVGLAGHREDIF